MINDQHAPARRGDGPPRSQASGTGGMIDVGIGYGGNADDRGDVAEIGAATTENPKVGIRAIRARSMCAPARSSGNSRPCPKRAAVSRHVGRWLGGPIGHQHVGLLGAGRRGARHRLHPARLALAQLLGRQPPGGNVYGNSIRRARREDRQISLGISRRCTTICGIRTCRPPAPLIDLNVGGPEAPRASPASARPACSSKSIAPPASR
jgi:hypothetical protein